MNAPINRGTWTLGGPSDPRFVAIIFCEDQHTLRIPDYFVTQYMQNWPTKVALTTGDGISWPVKLVHDYGGLRFTNGWSLFSQYYEFGVDDVLIFAYISAKRFMVTIFDKKTSCERMLEPLVHAEVYGEENADAAEAADEPQSPTIPPNTGLATEEDIDVYLGFGDHENAMIAFAEISDDEQLRAEHEKRSRLRAIQCSQLKASGERKKRHAEMTEWAKMNISVIDLTGIADGGDSDTIRDLRRQVKSVIPHGNSVNTSSGCVRKIGVEHRQGESSKFGSMRSSIKTTDCVRKLTISSDVQDNSILGNSTGEGISHGSPARTIRRSPDGSKRKADDLSDEDTPTKKIAGGGNLDYLTGNGNTSNDHSVDVLPAHPPMLMVIQKPFLARGSPLQRLPIEWATQNLRLGLNERNLRYKGTDEQWKVICFLTHTEAYIIKGWSKFTKEKNVQVNNLCSIDVDETDTKTWVINIYKSA